MATPTAAPTAKEQELIVELRKRLTDVELTEEQNRDCDLVRWIRAREHKLDQAETMLRKHLVWRKENDVDNALKYEPPPHFADAFPWEFIGFDEDNSPVIICQFGHWDMKEVLNRGEAKEFMRFKDKLHETVMNSMRGKVTRSGLPVTQFISICDMNNISYNQTSFSVIQLLGQDSERFESNFPERLRACYIINIPWFFSLGMTLLRPFIPQKTLEKFKIFGKDPKDWQPALKEITAEDKIPTMYGGTKVTTALKA